MTAETIINPERMRKLHGQALVAEALRHEREGEHETAARYRKLAESYQPKAEAPTAQKLQERVPDISEAQTVETIINPQRMRKLHGQALVAEALRHERDGQHETAARYRNLAESYGAKFDIRDKAALSIHYLKMFFTPRGNGIPASFYAGGIAAVILGAAAFVSGDMLGRILRSEQGAPPVAWHEQPTDNLSTGRTASFNQEIEYSQEYFSRILSAAEKGDPVSQYIIAIEYEHGSRITKIDYNKAAMWYLRSSYNGNSKAMAPLSIFYLQGKGVEKDILTAYAWAAIAVRLNNSAIGAQVVLDALGPILSEEQLNKARDIENSIIAQIASEWGRAK